MSGQNPYETLGVTQDASFDDIQEAKSRLSRELGGDRRRVETIEAAYDAIIMERLRLRQEGKISVPEGIRFPERETPPPASGASPAKTAGNLLSGQQWVDTPEQREVLIAMLLYGGLGVTTLFIADANQASALSAILAIAFGLNLYLLTRKENRFGRACLLTLGGFILSTAIATIFTRFGAIPQGNGGLSATQLTTLISLLVFWLTSSFIR